METKSTPGPWLLEGATVYKLSETSAGDMNRWSATIHKGFIEDGQRVSDEEIKANARLIAAAPELLEALNQIGNLWPVNTTAKVSDVNGINDGRSRAILLETAIDVARAAIAKAKGRAP